jgi:hypothetical protein
VQFAILKSSVLGQRITWLKEIEQEKQNDRKTIRELSKKRKLYFNL